MKLLTITVPCYNSAEYMYKNILTLIPIDKSRDVEIIIVNDGSKDDTLKIAKKIQDEYPEYIKIVDKENGGHGSAVNAGIENASGKYFKVVDSDDWVDSEALVKILETLRKLEKSGTDVDMLLSNYIYDKVGVENKRVIRYTKQFAPGQVLSWHDAGHFPLGTFILMHAITYRTQILHDCELKLPNHTFYVDNIFAFKPLPYVKKIYYIDVDFYHYFIGRDDQSVNEKIMINRIDQQLKVNKIMTEEFQKDSALLKTLPKLRRYMFKYLEIITSVSSIMCYLSKDEANYNKKEELWNYIKKTSPSAYRGMKSRVMGIGYSLPGKVGRKICILIYRYEKRKYGFN